MSARHFRSRSDSEDSAHGCYDSGHVRYRRSRYKSRSLRRTPTRRSPVSRLVDDDPLQNTSNNILVRLNTIEQSSNSAVMPTPVNTIEPGSTSVKNVPVVNDHIV